MKKVYLVLTQAILLCCLSLSIFAQNGSATTTAVAVAVIVAPISITKTIDFDFGLLATDTLGGTATLAAAGGAVTTSGGVGVVVGGSSNSASFTVTGEGTNAYTISFPASVSLVGNPTGAISLATFTTASGTAVGTLVAGAQTFTAGGTLTIPPNTAAGTYTSAAFNVTVIYN